MRPATIDALRSDPEFMAGVTRWQVQPARSGVYEPLPTDLDARLVRALTSRGIDRLYVHQRSSYDHIRAGSHTVVVTPTASGKTLCYNLPILQTILARPDARAMYLFPTKALSQDQQAALNEAVLFGEIPVKIATYDGDTPSSLRAAARDTGQIIITNPDMLHAGILPNHPRWTKFLSRLQFVVIDEVHQYRGVFGSHVANVVRRLKRVTDFYGVRPVFVCCSATIGNPQALAERIIGEPAVLVDRNGAPAGEKHVVLYNPPLVDRVQGIRRGTVNESQRLAVRLLREGVKTIVFARSRVRVELIATYIRQSLANFYNDNQRIRVEAYRGGYLPNERRTIEQGLRSGAVHGVVSTNALELGIDIGGLDAAVLAGLPGSIASAWQQAGRAGRTSDLSLAIMVASAVPLDQYMVKHPDYFFGRGPEHGFVDPENVYINTDHLRCAAFELPFRDDEHRFPEPWAALELLEEAGTLRRSGGALHWADRSYPAEGISLRSASSDNVVIVDRTGGGAAVIGEMDRPSAKEMLYPQAVYLHRGRQFVAEELDLANRRCFVRESDGDFYTDAMVKRDIQVLTEDQDVAGAGIRVVVGDVLVRSQVSKFKKIRFHTHENIGYGDVNVPEEQMHTRALILVFAADTAAGAALAGVGEATIGPIINRFGTLLKNVAPAFLLCDAGDIGVAERVRDPHFEAPAVYLFDAYPGGSGLCEALVDRLSRVVGAAQALVGTCGCDEGCPSCVGPRDPDEEVDGNPKTLINRALNGWLNGG